MGNDLLRVRFLPSGATVSVARGTSLSDAAALAGISLDMPCGGQGNCGKCKVQVTGGATLWTNTERSLLNHEELQRGFHLACQMRVFAPLIVEVPTTSLLASTYKILADAHSGAFDVSDAPVRVRSVVLEMPSLSDDASDLERLERELGPLELDLGMMRALPALLREQDFRGTAVLADRRLLAFSPPGDAPACVAAAFDIGTTTLAASLIDLADGRELARAARLNPQTKFGDDVLARISYASTPDKRERLRHDIVDSINEMLQDLAEHADARIDSVYAIACAGNTTMQHLLLGIDPVSIGVSPFVPAVSAAVHLPASEIGIHSHAKSHCYVFPAIAGYVGGDTVAGLAATRFAEAETPSLFIDIGTNGELVANADGRLVATSCAAGPAFEGTRIAHGVRAAAGAIEAVHIEDDLVYKTIGGAQPIGICGSGLIDIVAELLRLGIVCQSGVLLGPNELPEGLPGAVVRRIHYFDDQLGFVIADADETQTGQVIALYQNDVRQVQLATAAVRSAIAILLDRIGVRAAELRRVLVAGAFGNYIRCSNAQRMGLLPGDVDPERIAFVGNTSLAGARLAATSLKARREAEELAKRTEHLDLSLDPAFQEIYVDALFFPELTSKPLSAWREDFSREQPV
ncbi:MAG: DUF4445 domain-containing protein [Candidatus Hydrogenedentes bacterium]|nr:DUF4445 domain-containing protein [Candidatus Hydrogenedentota bacterium]